MSSVRYFENITIPAPLEKIYKRLGYHRNMTRMAAQEKKEIEGYIEEAASLIRLQGAAARRPVEELTPERTVLSGNIIFQSRKLSGFLKGSSEVLLMAATSGPGIITAIKKDTEGGSMTRGVVLDAAAGEMADAALDWIMKYYGQELRRENKRLAPKRFSAGYGDFLLENQRAVHTCLELHRIGIAITETFLLVPEKSVTAVAGISSSQ